MKNKEQIARLIGEIKSLQKTLSAREKVLGKLLNLNETEKIDLQEIESFLADQGYDGVHMFYILRRKRAINSE